MKGFEPYPQYKDSRVEWLGKVPEYWDVVAIKWLTPVLRGASPRPIDDPIYFDDEGEYGWVRISDVTASSDGYLYETTQQLSNLGASLSVKMEPGNLFVSIAGSVGKPCIPKIKCCIHDGFVYFPYLSTAPKFLYRIFEAGVCFGGLGKMGTQLNLNTETVGGIKIALPPYSEVLQVLEFLDHETGKIDGLIAEQEKLIELLKEKRQALALQAYLDRDSTILRLGNAVDVIARPVQYESEREYVALGIYNRGRGLFHKESKPQEELGDSDFFVIEEGDLILSGQFAWEGSVALAGPSETGTIVSHRYPVIRGKAHICLTEYVFALLTTREGDFLLNECSRGAAGRNRPLNIGALLKEKIKIPNVALQRKIVSFVHEERKLLGEIKSTIKLLEERRSVLVSAVVTGKIDVRNWKPQGDAA